MTAFNKAWRVLKFGYPAGYDAPDEVKDRHNVQFCPKCRGTGIESDPKYGDAPCRLCNGSGMRMSVNPTAMQQYQSQLPRDMSYEGEQQ
jgi:hypothetical protein|tara:strand:+ start:57 stop:323 length:267 start_codon:yes stop_codon:yes gene_type:complete